MNEVSYGPGANARPSIGKHTWVGVFRDCQRTDDGVI